jgi:hypothetical protein
MELFIPSLIAIIFAAAIVMFILPRLSPVILGVLALVFLILSVYQHYSFFSTEYRQSTWQMPLVQYAPYVLLGSLTLFLIFFIVNFIGTGSTAAAAPLQNMNAALEKVTNQIPAIATVANSVTNTVKNAMGMNAKPGANNAAKNTSFSRV